MGWMNSEDGSKRYGPLTKREISAMKDDLEGGMEISSIEQADRCEQQ
jgi:hypothetical protein